MRKILLYIVSVAILFTGSLITTSAVALAGDYNPDMPVVYAFDDATKFLYGLPNTSGDKYDDKVISDKSLLTITVVASTPNGNAPEKIDILVDNSVVKTCNNTYFCRTTVGPYSIPADDGNYTAKDYFVRVSNKGFTSTITRRFWIVKEGSAPRVYANITNKSPKVGENTTIKARAMVSDFFGDQVTTFSFYIDGRQVSHSCVTPTECYVTTGIFSSKDIGPHTYKVDVATVKNGIITRTGGYVVYAQADNIAPTVQITTENPRRVISAKEVVYLPTDTVNIVAKASDNVSVALVRILLEGKALPITCSNNNNECRASIPPSKEPFVGFGVFELSAEVYDAAGNKGVSNLLNVLYWNLTDNTPPVVTLSADRYNVQTNQPVTITARATDSVSVKNIILNWGATEIKTCTFDARVAANDRTCSYTFNSLPPVVNHFTAKAADWSYNVGNSNEVLVDASAINSTPTSTAPTSTPASIPANNASTLAISISTDRNVYTASSTITFTAASPVVVKKIDILVNARKVKECMDTNICVYIGGPYPAYANTAVAYGSNAYDASGNRAWSGYKGVGIRPVQP